MLAFKIAAALTVCVLGVITFVGLSCLFNGIEEYEKESKYFNDEK